MQYIKVCLDNAADAEGSNISVVLSNYGAASCFRFRSRHSLKLADDPVCNLDVVFIVPEDLADSHFLNCDVELAKLMHTWPRKMKHRVAALLTGMTCMVQRYSRDKLHPLVGAAPGAMPVADERKFVPIRGGQVVRLFHSRLDSFLATSPTMVSSTSLIVLEDADGFDQPGAASRLEQPSAYSMWIVERANPTEGSWILYDQYIRLRNLATNLYLCPNRSNTTVIAKEIHTWSASGKSKRTLSSSICHFSRLKENNVDDPQIGKRSDVWLNFPSLESDESSGLWLQTSGSAASPTLELCNALGPTDGFVVHPVNDTDLKAPFQIVSVSHTVREYIVLIKELGFCSETAVQTERIIQILKVLMKLFDRTTLSTPEDSAGAKQDDEGDDEIRRRTASKRIEREIYQSQAIVRELQLMDNLVELVDFHTWSVPSIYGCVQHSMSTCMQGHGKTQTQYNNKQRLYAED